MRGACLLLLIACPYMQAQNAATPRTEPEWRRTLTDYSGRSPGSLNSRDIQRLDESMRLATPYFSRLTPGEYESNRELARRIAAYLAAEELKIDDPRMRGAIDRLRRSALALRLAIPMPALPPDAAPAVEDAPPAVRSNASDAPFLLAAPNIENVPAADKDMVAELVSRYEADAANAAAAWANAESVRQNLAARGMSLNARTSSALSRMQLYCQQAAAKLARRDWAEARVSLERAEYETERVLEAVGR